MSNNSWFYVWVFTVTILAAATIANLNLKERLYKAQHPSFAEQQKQIHSYMQQGGEIRWAWKQAYCK